MADALQIRIEGLDQLAAAFQRFPQVFAKTIFREALHNAGDVMLTAAEATVPVLTGELKADLISKVYVAPDLLFGSVRVGPGYDRGQLTVRGTKPGRHGGVEPIVDTTESPGVYAKFVEEGHKVGHRGGKEIEYGSSDVPAHPWLRPSFEESAPQALGTFIATCRSGFQGVIEGSK